MTFSNSIGKKSNGLALLPTGTSAGNTGELRFRELLANGTNYVSIKAPDVLSSNFSYTLPDAFPLSNGQVLAATTAGVMSWADNGGTEINNNVIINPEMLIAQRGTSFPFVGAVSGYTMDRWQYGSSVSGANVTVTQSSLVPSVANSNYLFTNSLLATNNASVTPGAGLGVVITHKVEGFNFKTIAQRNMTISFWVRSSVTGTYSLGFQNAGLDRSYVAEYTINSANTWEKKTVNILATPSTGTWNLTNGIGLFITFTLSSAGSVQTSTLNSWITGNVYSSTNQVNFTGTNGATFYLTGVKLEEGNLSTDFKGNSYGIELELCQRYFNTQRITVTNSSAIGVANGRPFPCTMRASPSLSLSIQTGSGASFISDKDGLTYQSTANTVDSFATYSADSEL